MVMEENSGRLSQGLTVPMSIVIAGALVAAAIYFGNGGFGMKSAVPAGNAPAGGQVAAVPTDVPAVEVDSKKVSTENDPFVGSADAPVTVAYWYDYQCPYCKQLESTVMSSLVTDFANTGKVKVVFKDFQFLGADSTTAGLASHAVWEVAPTKFYDWHKAMFEKQDAENAGWGTKADVLALTKTIPGIDATKVEALMTSKAAEYQKGMDADRAEGTSMHVTGTPALIIGKQFIAGAQTYDQVKAAIDAASK